MVGLRITVVGLRDLLADPFLSRFVRDLLDVPSAVSLSDSPVNLDYSTATIRLFIDLAYSRHMPSLKHVKLSCLAYEELFKLCDQLEAPDIASSLSDNIRATMRSPTTGLDPWRVFKLAAGRDDIELARLAAVKIHKTDFGLGDALFNNKPAFFDGIPSRYMAALMRCAFKSVGHFGPKESVPRKGWIQRNVDEIANASKLD